MTDLSLSQTERRFQTAIPALIVVLVGFDLLTDTNEGVRWQLESQKLSLKEIDIRRTAEKTVRLQSVSIYSKAGLAWCSELSAFFLEDLLLPNGSPENEVSHP